MNDPIATPGPEDAVSRPEEVQSPPAENQRDFAPCMCGQKPERLVIEVAQDNKLGRATCDKCGVWTVDFLRGHATEPDQILDKAHAAWDSAPRT